MPKIIMRQTKPGSMDGITINLYVKDREYKIDDSEINQVLADAFIDARWAKIVRERDVPPANLTPPETAVIVNAPETKNHPVPELLTEEETESIHPEVKPEAKSTRVFELAKDLKTNYGKIIKVANRLEIMVTAAQSGLTDSEVKKIKEAFNA